MKKKIWFLCILCLMLVMLLPLSASAEEKLKVYVHDSLTMLYEVVGGSGQHEIVTATLSDWSGVLVQSTSLPISYPFEDDRSYTLTITVRDLVTGETVTGSIWNTYEDPSYEYWCSQGDHNDYESEDEGGWGFNTWTVSSEYFDITDTHHSVKGVEAYRCIDCNAYMYSREFEYTRIHIIKPATGRCECGYDEKTVTNVPEGLFYKIENEAVTITGYKSKTNTLVIPAEIEGYPVTKIDRQAFRLCTSLTSITIPDSVTSIEEEAFSCCYGLTSITIPDNVTYIGKYAFSSCDSLTSITIPDSVTSIDTLSFYDCDSLNSITIPESVTYIGEEPFFGCENLALITVSPNNPAYTSVDGILFNKDKTVLIQYPAGKLSKSYTIPQGTQKIGNYAFELCSKLTSIIIPNSVTSIGYYAFTNCTSLTNISIPNSVTSIGKCAFNYCHGLTSITIPSSVTSIGDWLFYFCGYQFTINVEQDSYAHQWCLENGYEDIVQFICADNNRLGLDAAKERYSIYVEDPYYYPQYDMIILRKGIGIHLMVYDKETDQVLVAGQVEHLDFEQIEEANFGTLNDNHVFQVHEGFQGTYHIVLTYNGVEIDRIDVTCSTYDDDMYSENLRLDTMQFFNWQREGMWISSDLQIFDFEAELKNNMPDTYPGGYYEVSMEIYNTSPVIYGALVYDDQNKLINTSYINSFWSEFSAWGVIEYVYLGFRDFWDFRAGNTESYACKSVINLKVPIGGCIKFADPMEKDDLITANYINGALSILSTTDSWESLIDVIGINDKAAFRKALKEMEWDDLLSEITISYQQSTTADIREEALKAVLKGGWETIISDKKLMESIAVAIPKSFVSLGVNELADYGLLAASVPSYYIMHATDGLGQSIQLNNLKNMLVQSDSGDSLIKIEYVLFPNRN